MKSRINVDKSINKNCALLIVTVLKNANVIIEKNDIILTPKYWVDNINNTLQKAVFSIPQIFFDAVPWTVTITSNNKIITETIIINSIKEYTLHQKLYLFHNGVINPNNIDGCNLIHTRYANGSTSSSSMTVTDNLLICYQKYSSGSYGPHSFYYTESQIDVTPYKTFYLTVTEVTVRGNGTRAFGLWQTTGINISGNPQYVWGDAGISSEQTQMIDISNVTELMYIAVKIITGANQTSHYIKVKDWYLET